MIAARGTAAPDPMPIAPALMPMTDAAPPRAPTLRRLALADEAQTFALARRIGLWLRPGDVLALSGDLGSGKTSFARALIQSLQAREGAIEAVPSPTFTLVQIYRAGDLSLWHFDLYRLAAPEEALELGIEEAFAEGVSLIEWPERLGEWLPEDRLDIALAFAPEDGADSRRVTLAGQGGWAARLAELWPDG